MADRVGRKRFLAPGAPESPPAHRKHESADLPRHPVVPAGPKRSASGRQRGGGGVAPPDPPPTLSANPQTLCQCGRKCRGRVIKTADPEEMEAWLGRVVPRGAGGQGAKAQSKGKKSLRLWTGHWAPANLFVKGCRDGVFSVNVKSERVLGEWRRVLPESGEPLSPEECEVAELSLRPLDAEALRTRRDATRSEISMKSGRKPCRCGAGEACSVDLVWAQSRAHVPKSAKRSQAQELARAWRVLLPIDPTAASEWAKRKGMPSKFHWREGELELARTNGAFGGAPNLRCTVKVNPKTGELHPPRLQPHDWRGKEESPRVNVTRMEHIRGMGGARASRMQTSSSPATARRKRRLSSEGTMAASVVSALEALSIQRGEHDLRTTPARPQKPIKPRDPAGYDCDKYPVLKRMQADKDKCCSYTGGPDFDSLMACFEHMNANHDFEKLRPLKSPSQPAPARQADHTKLTAFEQFVFFKIAFRRLRGNGLLEFAGDFFDLATDHALKLYAVWVVAVGRFFQGQQHPATRSQAEAAMPNKSIANLNITDGEACVLGDCTERFCQDCSSGGMHSVLYSQYKHHCTIKLLCIQTMDHYSSYIPPAFAGACTGNAAHIKANIPQII